MNTFAIQSFIFHYNLCINSRKRNDSNKEKFGGFDVDYQINF